MPPSSHPGGWTGSQNVHRSPPLSPPGEEQHEAVQKHVVESSSNSTQLEQPAWQLLHHKHLSHEDISCDIPCTSNSAPLQSTQSTSGLGLLSDSRTVHVQRRVPCYSPAAPHNLPRTPVPHTNVPFQSSSSGRFESQHNIFKRPTYSPRAGARLVQRKITSPLGHRLPKK